MLVQIGYKSFPFSYGGNQSIELAALYLAFQPLVGENEKNVKTIAAKLPVHYSSLPASVVPADSESCPTLHPPLAIEVTPNLEHSAESQPSEPSAPTGPTNKRRWSKEVEIFISTFLTIFLAELGDKTQLTTLLMAAESHSPWIVFAGAGAALILTSLLGVWLGCWLAKRVSPRTLEIASGSLLLAISALLLWDVIRS